MPLLGHLSCTSADPRRANPRRPRIPRRTIEAVPVHLRDRPASPPGSAGYDLAYRGKRYAVSVGTNDVVDTFVYGDLLLVLFFRADAVAIGLEVFDLDSTMRLGGLLVGGVTAMQLGGAVGMDLASTRDVALELLQHIGAD